MSKVSLLNNKPSPFTLRGTLKSNRFKTFCRQIENTLDRVSGLKRLDELYQTMPACTDSDTFLSTALKIFNIEIGNDLSRFDKIPKTGAVVVVANHPFGALDGIILTFLLRRYRQDVKVLANYHLAKIDEIQECFIAVDPFDNSESQKRNIKPLKESIKWLKQGGLLLTFPAGEVSHFSLRKMKVTDSDWSETIGKLVKITAASVNTIYFHGGNSRLFNLLGFIHPSLRTFMLPRELLNKQGRKISWELGENIPNVRLRKLKSAREIIDYLKFRTYMLADMDRTNDIRKKTDPSNKIKIIDEISPELTSAEVQNLPGDQLLVETDTQQVYFAYAKQIPWTLQEIGRLRELTFRDAGEGSGNDCDIDLYDDYYIHVFVWHRDNCEVIGAYRLGISENILQRYGKKGLYTFSLFHYKNRFVPRLHNAIELGRSFVRPEYQKSIHPLNLLWKGIAAFIYQQKEYPVLFGPVSISHEYQAQSKKLMVETLRKNAYRKDYAQYIKARNPYKGTQRYHWRSSDLKLIKDIELVSDIVSQIELDKKGMPVLFKQYLKLGGRFMGFNVDPEFSDVIDGLIVVDLRETDPDVLKKYMGKEQADEFLMYHKGHKTVAEGRSLSDKKTA